MMMRRKTISLGNILLVDGGVRIVEGMDGVTEIYIRDFGG